MISEHTFEAQTIIIELSGCLIKSNLKDSIYHKFATKLSLKYEIISLEFRPKQFWVRWINTIYNDGTCNK